MQCLYVHYVAGNITNCLLTRGDRLQEVSVSGGSTVYENFQHLNIPSRSGSHQNTACINNFPAELFI